MKTKPAASKIAGLFILSLVILTSCPNPIQEELLDTVKDKIAPEIELFTPKEGSYCAKTVVVTGKVKDKSSDSGNKGKINKVQFEVLSSSISGDADLESSGTFSFEFSTVNLDSNFVLKVTAEDWNGNIGEATLNLTLMDGSDIPSFTAVAGNKKVKLTWDDVPNTSSYTFYYTTEGSTPSEDFGLSISDITSPYTLSGLKNGAMHVFKLRAHSKDSDNDDNWSGLKQAIPLSTFTLAPKVS